MEVLAERFSPRSRVAVAVAVLAMTGCADAPPTAARQAVSAQAVSAQAVSAIARPAISALARAELNRSSNEVRLARDVIHNAAIDGSKNADEWFGKRSERNRERFCDGVRKLVTSYMPKAEIAAGTQYDQARKERIMLAALNGAGCVPATQMNVFGNLALSGMGQSEGEEYDVTGQITDALWNAMMAYQDYSSVYGPGDHASFCGGLTALEVEVFDSTATRSDSELAYYEEYEATNGSGGTELEPMSLFFQSRGTLRRALVAGCISNVTTNVSSIVSGARSGGFLCGFWCAVGGAVLVTGEVCAWGSLGGYLAWRAGW